MPSLVTDVERFVRFFCIFDEKKGVRVESTIKKTCDVSHTVKSNIFTSELLNMETDGGDYCFYFSPFEFPENCCFSGSVETDHNNILFCFEIVKYFCENVSHFLTMECLIFGFLWPSTGV